MLLFRVKGGAIETVRFYERGPECERTAVPGAKASACCWGKFILSRFGAKDTQFAMSGVVEVRS